MVECESTLSILPENFTEIPVADALDILAANHVVDSTFYYECKRRQEELAGYIRRNE